jgi:tRNA G18 (ribose-2'-O)-methylase SpoU
VVPFRYVSDAAAFLRKEVAAGTRVVALEITDRSENLLNTPIETPLLLVVGAEATGVAPELLSQCERSVYLPMHGRNTSMNVAVALGAAIYLLLMKLQ